jgi:CubicO group peptidase (beta-lactamase class C family)
MIKILKILFYVLLFVSLLLIVTGNSHVFRAVRYTYLSGKTGPSPDEFMLFPYNRVAKGEEKPWPLSADYNSKMLSENALQYLEDLQTLSFAVFRNDSLLFEKYWEERSAGDLSNSFSMAKSIVSVLTGIAIKEGKIKGLDQPVADFIPEFNQGERKKIKIRHLLSMSSGINFDEDYGNPFAYPARAYYGTNLRDLTLNYEVNKEPGTEFEYLSGNTELMAFVLQQATGRSLSNYASEKLWKPLGASENALWSLDQQGGVEKAYCCFNSNARDFARIGSLYMHLGKIDSCEIIPEWFVKESIRPAKIKDPEKGEMLDKYGLSWWLTEHRGLKVFYARGILGQYILCIPEKNLMVVRLGRKRNKEKQNDHPVDIYQYLDAGMQLAGIKA